MRHKLTPIYIFLVLAIYNTQVAGNTLDPVDGARAYTLFILTILQIIILLMYEFFRVVRVRIQKK